MPYREGIDCLLLGQKYRRRVRQVVLYVGEATMRMEDHVDLGETKSAYTLMDIREMDARKLMASGRPGSGVWESSGTEPRTGMPPVVCDSSNWPTVGLLGSRK